MFRTAPERREDSKWAVGKVPTPNREGKQERENNPAAVAWRYKGGCSATSDGRGARCRLGRKAATTAGGPRGGVPRAAQRLQNTDKNRSECLEQCCEQLRGETHWRTRGRPTTAGRCGSSGPRTARHHDWPSGPTAHTRQRAGGEQMEPEQAEQLNEYQCLSAECCCGSSSGGPQRWARRSGKGVAPNLAGIRAGDPARQPRTSRDCRGG